jgi:hypothetical protein
MDKGKINGVAFLDIRKAFDSLKVWIQVHSFFVCFIVLLDYYKIK